MGLAEKLIDIQSQLRVNKNNYNKFGNFYYRSCEDILETVKPLLKEHNIYITLSDEVVCVGTRTYIKATAKIVDGDEHISTVGYAREEENKKGMDGSQITGASSSYARKYALNGLFAIDDAKDSDVTNNTKKDTENSSCTNQTQKTYEDKAKKFKCVVCGKPFKPVTMKGQQCTAQQAYNTCVRKYGKAICKECREKEEKK